MRRVPAILIVIFIACPLLSGALLTISLSTWAMDRHFFRDLVGDTRLYQLPDAVSTATWATAEIEGSGGLQWKTIARAARVILTPEYLRGQALRLVDQVFDSLDGRSPRWALSVDVAHLKRALQGPDGARFARLLAEDLPVGGSRESFRVAPGRLPVSRPATLTAEQAAGIIQAGLPTLLRSVPDALRVDGGPVVAWHDTCWSGPRFPISGWLLGAGLVLLALGAGALTAAAFVGGEVARERLQWYGGPLLVPAAGTLVVGLLVLAGLSAPWLRASLAGAHLVEAGFAPSFIAAVADAARRAAARVAVGFLATGGISAGVAFGLLAWSWAQPHGKETA